MNVGLDLYRFINRLVYSEIPAPNHGDTTLTGVMDNDEINQADNLEFLRFEIAFPEVSGTYNQLNLATKNPLRKGNQQVKQENRAWDRVQQGVNNDVLKYGSGYDPCLKR
jgi:hypothetical protein